ncbi:carbohydrate ABC transporter permease [Halosolutus gelatinilyticus]|uniref:carbohydrate ABC transporter permease n=1 Tax=Halosolutus gelatinilyticus TaxID=2931975 RepID=UPI001FF3D126|nr:carbohydrate ABC transporter permease [Halosolutus gelatinilyticus]
MSGINEFVSARDPRRLVRHATLRSRATLLRKGGLFVLALVAAALFAFPFYWLLRVAAVWPSESLYGSPPSLIIDDLSLYNFVRVYYAIPFAQYAINSVIVSAMAVASQLIFCSLAAYGLSMDFYGKKYVMGFIVAAMMVPFQTIFLTDYLITRRLGLINTYPGLAIVVAVSVVNILVLKSAFEAVPDSMVDAARLDGASELYILFGVYWPLSKAALSTTVILAFVFSWNSYLWPLLIATQDSYVTLPLGLATFQSQMSGNFALQYAFTIMVLLPLLILFLLLQKYFIRSAVMSSIKT